MICIRHIGAPITLALFSAAAAATAAAPSSWRSDAMGTSMEISFNHSKLIDVPLILGTVTSTANIDDADLSKSTLQITADLAGLLSYNERWPKQLRSETFFDTTNSPQIVFTSQRIVRSGAAYKVLGNLTMHGVTKPETFSLSWSSTLSYRGIQFRGVTLTGNINWHDFGMTYKDDPELQNYPEFGSSFKIRMNVELRKDSPPQS